MTAYKTVMVIFPKAQLKAARQAENEIGRRPGHKATLKPEKEYKGQVSQIPTSQPQLFVGLSKAAEHLRPVMQNVFNESGATCHRDGARAIIVCEWPNDLEPQLARPRAANLAQAIEGYTGQKGGFELAEAVPDLEAIRGGRVQIPSDEWGDSALRDLRKYTGTDALQDYLTVQEIRPRFVDLLYLYAAARFTAQVLDELASG